MFTPFVYQTECLEAVEAVRQTGSKKALIVMASGLGKTVTMGFHAKIWSADRKGRYLYLCHQNDILYQAKTTFQAILGTDRSYGYFHGQEKNLHSVDFLFASLQTMEMHKELFDRGEFDYIVVDEGHHAHAPTYRSTIEYFQPDFLLGATATPDRLDELDIREIFGEEVFSLPLEEAMAKGYLAPVDYRLLTDEIQLSSSLETKQGRVSISALNRQIFIPRRDKEIAKIIAEQVAEIENPRVIIFCTSVKHCEHMAEFVNDSFTIHSRISRKEREVRMEMFRHGLIGTVLAVDCFNEGVDVPASNVLVFLRSTDSRTIFLQQLGRGLRRSEGKTKVVVLDFVANCERILMVTDLKEEIDRIRNGLEKERVRQEIDPMTLNIHTSGFQEKIIPLLRLLQQSRSEMYSTWQEASAAAKALKIPNQRSYFAGNYAHDPKLPSNPRQMYDDFPGWSVFLGTDHYPTWQEASAAAVKLGFKKPDEYRTSYKQDPRLPSSPNKQYADFPGWTVFLGKEAKERNYYPTWQEASKAAKKLGIKTQQEYYKKYADDPRLNSSPHRYYKDFPGYVQFLGKEQ